MLKLLLSLILLFLFSSLTIGQTPGMISGVQKISNTQGGLGNSTSSGGNFGNRLTDIGDIDGDGIRDLAVGEEYADDGGTDKGAIWILFMKNDGTVKSKQKISETVGNLNLTLASGTRFGFSVASLGDLNGDGVNDVAVGSIVANFYQGAVWILFLKSDGTVKSTAKIQSGTTNFTTLDDYDFFGFDIVKIGDLDNDGVDDIAVGAATDDDGGTDKGAVYIIFLKNDGTVKGYKKISSTQGSFSGQLDNSDLFGCSVAALGDIDSDGNIDLAVGAHNDDDGATDAGAVWLLRLKSDGTVKSHTKISNSNLSTSNVLAASSAFGRAISGTSDKNGDGINDLIVGAFLENGNGNQKGAVFIIFLNSSFGVKNYFKFNSQTSSLSSYLDDNDRFGTAVTSLDNFSKDSTHVIAVGAHNDDDGVTNGGAVYILFITPPPGVNPDLQITKVQLKDTICSDSMVSSNVFLKNKGNANATNPTVYFLLTSNKSIKQNFSYQGTIKPGDSVSFSVNLNLYSSGQTGITVYTSYPKDTIFTNDTFKTSVAVVRAAPDFSFTNVCIGESNSFLNSSTIYGTSTANYLWDFGDGSSSNITDPLHKYNSTGKYIVKLSANIGTCTYSLSKEVTVYSEPKVVFAANTTCLGKPSNFKATMNLFGQTYKSLLWNFGDGNSDTGVSASHTYGTAGTYNVKATITTTNGCFAEYSTSIKIEAIPQTGHTKNNDTLYANATNASLYQWYKNGIAIPNAQGSFYVFSEDAYYTVLVSSAAGCKDSAASKFEIKPVIQNYITGTITQSNGQPLKMSMVIIAKKNSADSTVTILDTVWTNQLGAYSYETFEKTFILYTIPTVTYPNELLTYYNGKLTVQTADELSLAYGKHTLSFATVARKAITGQINVSSKTVSCSTCKMAGSEVEKLDLLLMNEDLEPLYRLVTNQNGEIIFPSLTEAKYYLWADKMFIDNSKAPEFVVKKDMKLPIKITLHQTYLTVTVDTSTIGIKKNSFSEIVVYPNPTTGIITISKLDVRKYNYATITTLDGKMVWSGKMVSEKNFIDISAFDKGIYILKIQSDTNLQFVKIVKN